MNRLRRTGEVNMVDLSDLIAKVKWDINSTNQTMDKLQSQISQLLQGDLTDDEYADMEELYTEYSEFVKAINSANSQMESVLEPLKELVGRKKNEQA